MLSYCVINSSLESIGYNFYPRGNKFLFYCINIVYERSRPPKKIHIRFDRIGLTRAVIPSTIARSKIIRLPPAPVPPPPNDPPLDLRGSLFTGLFDFYTIPPFLISNPNQSSTKTKIEACSLDNLHFSSTCLKLFGAGSTFSQQSNEP